MGGRRMGMRRSHREGGKEGRQQLAIEIIQIGRTDKEEGKRVSRERGVMATRR